MDTIQNKVVLQEAWALFKQKGGFLVLVLLITVGINSALSFLFPMLAEGGFISQLLSIVQAVVSAILTLGISYILLRVVRGQSVSITDLFSQYEPRMVGIYLVSSILFSLIVVFGTLLVIIPGIIWAITFMFTTYFVVDKKTGILASLRESKKLTKGYRMQLFLFMLALIGINILGFMALLIGLFVSVTVSSLAVAIMYTKLLAQSEKMNETIQPIETISEKDHTFNYDETTASQEDVENLKERLSALNLEYPHDLNAEKIKKEYRLLLKKYHPDTRSKSLNEKEADRRFLQIKDAYENLEKYFKNN